MTNHHAMTVIILTYEGPAPEDRDALVRRIYFKTCATPSDVRDYVGVPGRPAIYNDSHGIELFALLGFKRLRPDYDFGPVGGTYQAGALVHQADTSLTCDGVVSAVAIGVTDSQLDAIVGRFAREEKDRDAPIRVRT